MTTPINVQDSKRFESIPYQVYTVFGWESSLGCISKTVISYRKFVESRIEEQNAKISFQSKVIIDLEGTFLGLEEALLHSLPKSGGRNPSGPFGSYVLDLAHNMRLENKLIWDFIANTNKNNF